MSGNEIIVYDQVADPSEFVKQLGLAILHSEMFGCNNASQGAVLALECMARRVPPMTLAERYHIIHGRLSMRADAMLADFRTKCGGGHRMIERTPEAAEIELTLNRSESQNFRLTWEEARQEPFVYVGKESSVIEKIQAGRWKELMMKPKYATPRSRCQMLWARVVSDGVRAMAPEVVAGYYTAEEIDDEPEAATSPAKQPPEATPIITGNVVEPSKRGGGLRLSGETPPQSLDENEVNLQGPCSADHVDMIRHLGQQLQIPVEAIKGMIERRGKSKLAELSMLEAEDIIRKLERKLREDEIPF
jgi:hypothetical protein